MIKKKAFVIGTNANKSLSPTIFNYWFKKYNIYAEYLPYQIKESEFNKKIKELFAKKEVCGINVTMPYKEKIINKISKIDAHARKIGAVNCITKKNNSYEGSNTDWIGFKKTIQRHKGLPELKNRKHLEGGAIVVGYGGSSKAIIYSLKNMGYKKITVFNRTEKKILETGGARSKNLDKLHQYVFDSDLVINTIPATKFYNNKIFQHLNKSKTFGFDIVYNKETNFLNYFSNKKRIKGIEMLASQAAPCFKLWFGIDPAVDKKLINILNRKIT